MHIELKQIVGELPTRFGVQKVPQDVDRIFVDGHFVGYLKRGKGGKVFGGQPDVPPQMWPEIVAAVKEQRPDMDDSEYSAAPHLVPEEILARDEQ